MYPLELEAASGADELDAVDVAILEEDDLCFRNPSTPAFRTPLFQESKYSGIQESRNPAQFQQTLVFMYC